MFKLYYANAIKDTDRLYYNYLGINRKKYPKWEGWKIINQYKDSQIDVRDINDETLEILVMNFYYVKYLEDLVD